MTDKLKVLDLFSGIGGFSLGLERTGGFETVAFCEIEEYPRRVLAKHWPDVPCYTDVRELSCERLGADGLGGIDIIVGGYPCQPFSTAGQRRGAEDDRHLWPEVKRLMATVRPTWGVFENVAGHISMGLDEVLSDLEGEGYTAWPIVIPACAVDAPHRRDRVWIVARNSDSGNVGKERGISKRQRVKSGRICKDVADASGVRVQGGAKQGGNGGDGQKSFNEQPTGCGSRRGAGGRRAAKWLPEPNVGRVANGVPRRVDRLKCLGNSVVPQIPEMIGYAILEAEAQK
jgi:DNA (cytosine-5)-methyltransferase 1